jgi:putative membrane protein
VTRTGLRPLLPWVGLGALVLAQICYPLTADATRAGLTVATVVLGYALSVGHALLTRGPRAAAALVAVATGGGFAIEALGVATGFPFGSYDYSGELGPKLAGVPLVIPLAWTWMAWPAWLTAARLVAPGVARVALAAVGLAAWDLFLDPQMVAAGHWRWRFPSPSLPGVDTVPLTNYAGWLLVSAAVSLLLQLVLRAAPDGDDRWMFALFLWTWLSSGLALGAFLGLPAAAGWGLLGLGLVAVPLIGRLR